MSSFSKKSYAFAIITALLTSLALTLILSVFLYFKNSFDIKISLPFAGISFIVTLLIFQYSIRKYIFKRVEKIYKDIMILESKTNPVQNVPISADMDFLTSEISKYAKLKKQEVQLFQAREEFRKEFVGNVAHELKTPLFTVQGYISTLLDGAMSDPEVLKKYLKRADKGVDRLIYIVQDLDMITKIEFGESKLETSNFDVLELIRNVFEELEMKAVKKNIALSLENSGHTKLMVHADRERIQQVLTNLVVNSIKYGHNNGTTEVSVEPLGDYKVVVRVTDNGEGIEEKHILRLFERFYRVDKSGARTEGGSGLGLSIVKHIIDAHQENIFVDSKYGIGSEFSFTLPLEIN
jgi:two-component system phosphate regulon sensor histidine kinase PhoR